MEKPYRILLAVGLFALISSTTVAQPSTANYTFNYAFTGSLEDISSGATVLLTGNQDDVASTVNNIGFTFNFMGVAYSQFSANSNGQIRLGTTVIQAGGISAYSASVPILAPMSGDNEVNNGMSFKVIGTAPNRILVVEWNQFYVNYVNITGAGNMQALLYEGSGKIEYIYGEIYNSASSAQTRSIFISSSNTATTGGSVTVAATPTYAATASPAANSFAASVLIANLASTSQGSRTVYTFTPPSTPPSPPGSPMSFTSITLSSMTLNWIDSPDEAGYAVFRSTDNITYSLAGNAAMNVVTFDATGLAPGTLYYWKVYALGEGVFSASLNGFNWTSIPSVSGTKSVGPTGDYSNITAAIAALNANGLAGATILELQSTYTSATEAYPITIGSIPGLSSSNTLSIQPASDATGLTISGSNTTAIIYLNAGKFVTINGQPGGTGGAKELTISNASTSGATVRFINDATNNTITYCNLLGVVTSASSGVVFFSTTTGTTGNDDNTIDHCNISAGTTTPTNCIYSSGTTTTPERFNSGITISDNNIFNFYINTASTVAIGVFASSGSSDWLIKGNSLYQTVTRTHTTTATGFIGISLANTTGNNFRVTNNYIGGMAPNAGGTPWVQNGATTHTFIGIRLSVGTTTASSVQGNTIRNISISTTSTSTINSAISAVTGSVNVGNITGNTIGRQDATGSITFTGSAAGYFYGILSGTGTPGIFNFSNNSIGGITIAGTGANRFFGIRIEGTAGTGITVDNNTIGSATTANSITSNANTYLVGISSTNSGTPLIATNNLIANLQHTSTGSVSFFTGIEASSAVGGHTISGNTIRNITSTSTAVSSSNPAAMQGIVCASTLANHSITDNTIRDLSNTAATQAVYINGILVRGGSTAFGIIDRNFIYNLTIASSSLTAAVQGVYLYDGSWNVVNNMIRLGTDISTGINPIVWGICEYSTAVSIHNIWFNSVFVGGTQGGETQNSACFIRRYGSTIDVRNNIFWNNRASTGTPADNTGRHYAIYDAVATSAGLTSDFNDLFADGNGGTIGRSTAADQITLLEWKTANPAFDANSVSISPPYIDPTNAATPDLHILTTTPTPIESGGITIVGITTDFDGNTRLSPPDIGADEFTSIPPCLPPSGVTVGSITSGGANLSWTAAGTETAWEYVYGISPLPAPTSSGTPTTSSTVNPITGLSASTTYDVYVRSNCGGGSFSAYTAVYSFETLADVPVNTNVSGEVLPSVINCYNAQETIYVAVSPETFTIQSGGEATFIAGTNIIYYAGTRVFEGGKMHGYISPGGPWCPPPTKKTEITSAKEESLSNMEHARFTLYPNPTNGNFIIVQKSSRQYANVMVEVYDMRGKKLLSSQMNGEKKDGFVTSSLSAGLYFVKVIAGDYTEIIKLIKTR
ncbi:MAG: T9SS type A sorting domain-containing protein [Bacteroidales bacterium]|nr:T9SS type A sorting domain-containing protein [Bacteroidales bacterium]